MAQITILLDPESEAKARDRAKKMNMSLDQWIADLVRKQTASAWPESVKKLAGAWPDFPSIEEIRRPEGEDVQREVL